MTRNIISLTTIPPRMDGLGPTLASLLGQDAPIDRVILWIPERYRRSEFRDFALPSLPAGVEIGRCEHDYGPATKILPAVRAFAGQDVRILYCDDDRIYHRDWAAHLLSESDRFPADCLCEAGERIEVTALRAFSQSLRYQIFAKLSLGIYGHFHRRRIRGFDPGHGPVDIAKGYGGVLVRPEFIPESAFDIPDRLWTVDDVWLSGQMALNGVTIRKVTRREHSTKREVAEIAALIDFVHDGDGRDASNLACIRHFQEAHGIWLRQDDVGGGLTPADSRAGS